MTRPAFTSEQFQQCGSNHDERSYAMLDSIRTPMADKNAEGIAQLENGPRICSKLTSEPVSSRQDLITTTLLPSHQQVRELAGAKAV
jgi:hypothetical protein